MARERRYSALLGAAHALRLSHLLTGHQWEDQQETFLHRFARSSGVAGLAAIAATRPLTSPPFSRSSPLLLVRPLLSVPKARLRATCQRFGVQWVEDPSNDDARYERVRVRKALQAMTASDAGRSLALLLPRVQAIAAGAASALQRRVDEVVEWRVWKVGPFAVDVLDGWVWEEEGEEVLVAVLSRLLAAARASTDTLSQAAVLNAVRRIRRGEKGAILCCGCVLRPLPLETEEFSSLPSYAVTRPKSAQEVVVSASQPQTVEWDDRYILHLQPPPVCSERNGDEFVVRALQPELDLVGGFSVQGKGRLWPVLQHNAPALVWRTAVEPSGALPPGSRVLRGGRLQERVLWVPLATRSAPPCEWKVRLESKTGG